MTYTINGLEPDFSTLPEHMGGTVRRYIENGISPGHFLTAVICNDLREACSRADDENRRLLFEYVGFFYSHAPSDCWGGPEKYKAWMQHGGLDGMRAARDKDAGK